MGNEFYTKYIQVGERLVCQVEIFSLDSKKNRKQWLKRSQLVEIEQLLYEPIKSRVEGKLSECRSENILTGKYLRLGYVFKKKAEHHTLLLPSKYDENDEDFYSSAYSVYREKVVVFISSLESQEPNSVSKLVKVLHDSSQSQLNTSNTISISNYFTKQPTHHHGNTNSKNQKTNENEPAPDNDEKKTTIKNLVGKTSKAINKARKEQRITKVMNNMKQINKPLVMMPSSSPVHHNDIKDQELVSTSIDSKSSVDITNSKVESESISYNTTGVVLSCNITEDRTELNIMQHNSTKNKTEPTGQCLHFRENCGSHCLTCQSEVDYIDIQIDCHTTSKSQERLTLGCGDHSNSEYTERTNYHTESCSAVHPTTTTEHQSNFNKAISRALAQNRCSDSDDLPPLVDTVHSADEMPNIININSPSFESNPTVIKLKQNDDQAMESDGCPERPPSLHIETSMDKQYNDVSDVELYNCYPESPLDRITDVDCYSTGLVSKDVNQLTTLPEVCSSSASPGVENDNLLLDKYKPNDDESQNSFADDESSDSDLPDCDFIAYKSRRRTSLFKKALDICENLKNPTNSDYESKNNQRPKRRRSRHVLPSMSPTNSDEELPPAKFTRTDTDLLDDNMNEVSDEELECYILSVEKTEIDMDSQIQSVELVSNLSREQLKYLVLKNKHYLKEIFRGNTVSQRHADFKAGAKSRMTSSNNGKMAFLSCLRSRAGHRCYFTDGGGINFMEKFYEHLCISRTVGPGLMQLELLNHHVHLGLFTEEQQDVLMETLMSIFCKKNHKYLEYVMKVLLPEMLIKIHMEVYNISHQESENRMMNAVTQPGGVII